MTRDEKMHLLGHYEGTECVCGGKKDPKHWLCGACRKMFTDSKEGKAMDAACNAHSQAALDYLYMVKKAHEAL